MKKINLLVNGVRMTVDNIGLSLEGMSTCVKCGGPLTHICDLYISMHCIGNLGECKACGWKRLMPVPPSAL